jgi:hypothetical protein
MILGLPVVDLRTKKTRNLSYVMCTVSFDMRLADADLIITHLPVCMTAVFSDTTLIPITKSVSGHWTLNSISIMRHTQISKPAVTGRVCARNR